MSARRPALLVSHLRGGGKETCVVNLANVLCRTDRAPLIVSFEDIGALGRQVAPGVQVVAMRKRAGNDPLLPWRLARLFRREGVDLVHCHNWGTLVEGMIGARSAGIRAIVHTQHGLDYGSDAAPTRRRRARSLVKGLSVRWVRRVSAVSSQVAAMVVDEWGVPAEKVTVIHNGIPTQVTAVTPDERGRRRVDIGIGAADFVVGCVGTIRAVKDYPTLVASFARVARDLPHARLLVAGDGPARAEFLSAVEQHGVTSRVVFLGRRTDVAELLPLIDVFALSSLNEGISLAILEAMAQGLPVVATRVGGNPEIITDGETGLLVPSGAPSEMAAAILRLATAHEWRRQLGSRARDNVEARFSIERMGLDYERLYDAASIGAENMKTLSRTGIQWRT